MSENITITFGANNSVVKPVTDYPNLQAIKNDANLQAFLGFPDNIEARVRGVSFSSAENFQPGVEVELFQASNTKGN